MEQVMKKPFYKLKAFLYENNIKQKEIAERIGMGEVTFSQKINRSGSSFTLDEVRDICKELNISADEFFLT